jgi:hypothetical protein
VLYARPAHYYLYRICAASSGRHPSSEAALWPQLVARAPASVAMQALVRLSSSCTAGASAARFANADGGKVVNDGGGAACSKRCVTAQRSSWFATRPASRSARLVTARRRGRAVNAGRPDAGRGDAVRGAWQQRQQRQQQRQSPNDKVPVAQQALTKFLELPAVPIGSYVSSPVSPLHCLDPRVKQAWLAALLLLPPNGTPEEKVGICVALALATATTLPTRVWQPQLISLAGRG